MRSFFRFLRWFLSSLYHQLAWGYDLVAGLVSLGRWRGWVNSVVPFFEGARILELGHGPGHLQKTLFDLNLHPVGLDASPQMGKIARKTLRNAGYTQVALVRGKGQTLPFRSAYFDSIVATFPTEYIFEKHTLSEARRTLVDGGRMVILPAAWITGSSLPDRFGAWLFRVTGQAPANFGESALARLIEPFPDAGFQVETKILEVKSSRILIIIANKFPPM
jgi:ubiquinone/menaquinone biosynthesis C-methylase UbiE